MTTAPSSKEKLSGISKQLAEGIKPNPVTARTFIGWFGAQRRSSWNVSNIRIELGQFGLITKPDFQHTYIDSFLEFLTAPDEQPTVGAKELLPDVEHDPTYRIGKLASANNKPVSVRPDDEVAKAVTLMILHDYSQLPVMTSERDAPQCAAM